MKLRDHEYDARLFDGLTAAIRSNAPVHTFDLALGGTSDVAAGLSVYRNNVRAAYLRTLADIFPVVQRLVGEEFFRYLAQEYFYAHPPSSKLAIAYGDAMPGFLDTFEAVSDLPYLADVARLELLWLSAFHAAEASPLEPDQLLSLIGDAAAETTLALHPSVRLLSSIHPVYAIWAHNRHGAHGTLTLPDHGENVLIVRPHHEVLTSVITPGVYAAIEMMLAGASFHSSIEAAMNADPETQLSDLVHRLASSSTVTGIFP